MLAVILILLFALYTVFFLPAERLQEDDEPAIRKAPQMRKLWSVAQLAMKERKTLRAEKALLTILKFDEKNAAAYNRLGILYAKERQFKEAIECFEIAQSLDNNASSMHNVGLIYLETENYEKAAMAFEQAIALEGDLPARYIAFAKAQEKLGHRNKALESLETAYDLDPNTTTLRHILEVHERAEDEEGVAATRERISKLIAEKKSAPQVIKRKILRRVPKQKVVRPVQALPKKRKII